MGETIGCVKHCLGVLGLLAQLHNGINDVRLNTVVLYTVRILGFIEELFVGFIILKDVLEAL